MTIEELLSFAKEEHQRLLRFYNLSPEQLTYPNVLKVVEETGELCEALLSQQGIQRAEKLQNTDPEVAKELVDVLITLLVLSENLEVNVEEELKRGIERRRLRKY